MIIVIITIIIRITVTQFGMRAHRFPRPQEAQMRASTCPSGCGNANPSMPTMMLMTVCLPEGYMRLALVSNDNYHWQYSVADSIVTTLTSVLLAMTAMPVLMLMLTGLRVSASLPLAMPLCFPSSVGGHAACLSVTVRLHSLTGTDGRSLSLTRRLYATVSLSLAATHNLTLTRSDSSPLCPADSQTTCSVPSCRS